MQVGKLKEENNEMLEGYKKFGFSNKTKMLDHALDLLRENLNKEKRRSAREKMLGLYSQSSKENYFEELDGEDFE
ncbi:MAG: hypothetical protein ACXWQQ_02800 [Pseudobdellovibrio sp.]